MPAAPFGSTTINGQGSAGVLRKQMLSGQQQCSEFLSRILTGTGLRGRRAARVFHLSVSTNLIVGQGVQVRKKEVAAS